MVCTEPNENAIAFVISSELFLVDRLIQECEGFMRRHGVTEFSSVTVVLRELLVNAVVHGNRNAKERTVRCRVEHAADVRFKVVVEDEGAGFDYRSLDTDIPEDPRRMWHRGYVLVRNASDRVEFNEKGNCVTAYISAA